MRYHHIPGGICTYNEMVNGTGNKRYSLFEVHILSHLPYRFVFVDLEKGVKFRALSVDRRSDFSTVIAVSVVRICCYCTFNSVNMQRDSDTQL